MTHHNPVLDTRGRTLLRQAQRTAELGKRTAAEKLYRELVEEYPDAPEAWLGLADLVREKEEATHYYERTLALDPGNAAARRGLEKLAAGDAPAAALPELESALPTQPPQPTDLMPEPDPPHPAVEGVMVCANHPDTETNLRCNRCGKPICTQCAVLTPVGYRCKTCIRETEAGFFTATPLEYVLVALVTTPLSVVGGYFAGQVGFFIIFLAAAAGTLLGNIAFRVARRRRGRYLPYVAAGGVILGGIIGGLFSFGGWLWAGVYIFIAASAAYYRMR